MNSMCEHFHTNQASYPLPDDKFRRQDCLVAEPEDDAGIFARSHPRHKSTRDPFLLWVAFERNLHADHHTRRICPLIGCERPFDTSHQMQKHVLGCLQKQSGSYRCYKCWRQEKIGKYHTNGCQDVENHGGRFATVYNSFRSAKKRLAPRPQPSVEQDFDNGIMDSELHYPERRTCTELEDSKVCELTDSYICGELPDSSPQSNMLSVELSGDMPKRLSEMSSQSMGYGHSGNDTSESYKIQNFNHRPDVEMQSNYPHYQARQKPAYEPSGHGPAKTSSILPFQDHIGSYPAVSPTDLAEWSDSPVSPVGNGHSYDFFDPITAASLQSRHHGNGPSTYGNPSLASTSSGSSSGNRNWSGTPFFTPNAPNSRSYDLPSLSDTCSRKFSDSSGIESSPGQDYNDFNSPMIVQDSHMYDEPEIYDDDVPNVESNGRASNLTTIEQKWIFPLDENSIPHDFSVNPPWLHDTCSHPLSENSDYNVNSNQHKNVNISPPTDSTPIPGRPSRMASRRVNSIECPCGFRPEGIQKNRRGNLKRHMKGCKTAREQAHPDSSPIPKPWVCDSPGCEKRFSRRDNRRHHQKSKSHGPYASSSTSPAAERRGGTHSSGVS